MVEEIKLLKGLLRSIRIAKTVQMDQLSQQIKQISAVVDVYDNAATTPGHDDGTSTTLSACLRCGSEDVKLYGNLPGNDLWWVECLACGAAGGIRTTKAAAIADWKNQIPRGK
jgi:transcription elongation factor Elf1